MECNPSFIERRQAGFTLVEIIIATGIASLVAVTLASIYLYSTRTFTDLSNYMDFEAQSRQALDRISRTIRQADALTYIAANKATFQVGTNTISFTYYPASRRFLRESAGTNQLLLSDCDYVHYSLFQRNLTNGNYDYYPAATPASCKVVQLDWGCSRPMLGRSNTATAVSAKVVIRKQ